MKRATSCGNQMLDFLETALVHTFCPMVWLYASIWGSLNVIQK
jgi:hypothetical protein